MRFLVVIATVLVIALIGAAVTAGRSRLPGGVRRLVDTGLVFLLLGAVLGPKALNLITAEYLEHLGPVVVIALSWIGFFFGFNLQWRWLKRFGPALYLLSLVEALVTFGLVAAAFLILLPGFSGGDTQTVELYSAVVVLAAAAAGTAPASLFALANKQAAARSTLHTIRFVAALDDLPGLIALGLLFAFAHKYSSVPSAPLAGWQWLGLSIGTGLAFGLLVSALVPAYRDEQKVGLVILGVLALCGGLCAFVHLSPLFVSAVAGVTFANVSAWRERVYGGLAPREHAVYVFFLLLVGCLWELDAWYTILAAIYILVRAAGKLVGGALGSIPLHPKEGGPGVGLALLPQGGLAIAMAVDYYRTYGSPALPGIVTIVVIAVIVNELVGPAAAAGELRRRGEL